MKFEELNLHNDTLQALHSTNRNEATRLQQSILNAVRNEENLIINAEASEENYSAIAVLMADMLNSSDKMGETGALILSNSSGNLTQIRDRITELRPDGDYLLLGGHNEDEKLQSEQIEKGHAIVFAQPDQLCTIIKKNRYIFRHLKLLILDGFNEMIDEGGDKALRNIKKRILSDYKTIISTGQLNKVKKTAHFFAPNPSVLGFTNGESTEQPPPIPGHLRQGYIKVPPRMKITTLIAYIEDSSAANTVVFTASKRGTDRLYRILKKQRMKAVSLHHKLSDERRAQRLANFANGNVQYLLVSDISAAALDINNVAQVINYDVPDSTNEYRHRAALVGTGKNNCIVSLVSKQDQSDISQLRNELGKTPDELPLPDRVKQKLKGREDRRRSKNRNGREKDKDQPQKTRTDEPELPKPTYDQLSGGRSGNYDEDENGIVNFFKRLFS